MSSPRAAATAAVARTTIRGLRRVLGAAAELFITTAKEAYKTFLQGSPHIKAIPRRARATPGLVNDLAGHPGPRHHLLAVVPNGLDAPLIAAARPGIVNAADGYLDIIETQGYRVPFKKRRALKYPWGSNSFVLNNLAILALAHDFFWKQTYLARVIEGMDYILGPEPARAVVRDRARREPAPGTRTIASGPIRSTPGSRARRPGAVSGATNSGLEDL